MVVLLVLLLLSNLWFGWAADAGSSASSQQSPYDAFLDLLKSLEDEKEKRKELCARIKANLASVARSNNWKVESPQPGVLSIRLPHGETYVINRDCRILNTVPVGVLSPPTPRPPGQFVPDVLKMQDFTFQADVGLFRVLFQLLMYAAGIFWAVRAAQRLIEGELTEFFITFFIGFVIVASMYVLYRWMIA
jgi:putative component of toxin-antitoxin plasmid stabilization module